MKTSKKLLSMLLALVMLLSLVACGGGNSGSSNSGISGNSGGSSNSSANNGGGEEQAPAPGDVDNGDGTFYNEELGYTYGATFKSDEPLTYTIMFNDNDAYPIKDSWKTDGIFKTITDITNVSLDLNEVNNASYGEKVGLLINAGTAPYIIPKMYGDAQYVNGGGIVAVSDWVQYMPNYTGMIDKYDLQADVDLNRQADGKYYRLEGLKETALQDYSLLIRKDLFDAAGYDVTELEKTWTWEDFAEVLKGVKDYMVSQGMIGANDYIWSDRWCGATSGYGTGGYLLRLMAHSYGIECTWSAGNLTYNADLYYDEAADEFKMSAGTDEFKQMLKVVQGMVKDGILDPETWTQDDTVADSKFYTGKTALIGTNRSMLVPQDEAVAEQLGAGNYELYEILLPMGTTSYQDDNSRKECGVCISSSALNDMSESEFIRLMRFVDWLFYSDEALTMTKWGVEGETYTVDADGNYSLTPGYYCGGLTIPQTSDDQVDMRIELGYAGGNYMYSGSRELLASAFSPELRDFYDRMAEYRTLRPQAPAVPLDEDDSEMANMWGAGFKTELETWILRFCMNQDGYQDIDAKWDEFQAALQGQNAQNIIDMYNNAYQASK